MPIEHIQREYRSNEQRRQRQRGRLSPRNGARRSTENTRSIENTRSTKRVRSTDTIRSAVVALVLAQTGFFLSVDIRIVSIYRDSYLSICIRPSVSLFLRWFFAFSLSMEAGDALDFKIDFEIRNP